MDDERIALFSEAIRERGVGVVGRLDVTITANDCWWIYKILSSLKDNPTVLEFAGGAGTSTSCAKEALCDKPVDFYTIESDTSLYDDLQSIINGWGILLPGAADDLLDEIPDQLDALILDAYHHYSCAQWYITNLWPRVVPGGYCMIHDMFYRSDLGDEYKTVLTSLDLIKWNIVHQTKDESPTPSGWSYPTGYPSGIQNSLLIIRRTDAN